MPANRTALLTDLKRWVTRFENDLREQCREVPALDERLKARFQQAKSAKRTANAYSVWRDDELTQSAVAWVLSCVFVRFLEDNGLLETLFLSGTGENREAAAETRAAYFVEHRTDSDDDYLRHVFREVGRLPGMADLMDARHNALWNASISGDAAKEFIEFWRRIDPATGMLTHDFTDPEWDTRFLGDLYQDLSEAARKKFALLQTPGFIEEFILDRTLDPAIDRFGLKVVRMIDPTCGSGHFVLGGFRRLLPLWQASRPDLGERELAVHALNGVFGVDINPFAVAIARFRLLLEAWRFCTVTRLRHAPDFTVNLAVGDTLLHGRRFRAFEGTSSEMTFDTEEVFRDELKHHYEVEDFEALHRILGQQYHAVVGNPPYITVKDRAVSELYRARFLSCHRAYSLSVPFMERFFDLAVKGDGTPQQPAGFVGQITSNSFMKREFGKKLIEEYLPRWDLTHVLDTSGAYIPGHGTPTVILFGKNQPPVSGVIRTVLGIAGEPSTPEDPTKGLVWQAILRQTDSPGSVSEWMSAADSPRASFHRHPWSIGGGGAAELKQTLDDDAERLLNEMMRDVGARLLTRLDEVFELPFGCAQRIGVDQEHIRPFAVGEDIRHWKISPQNELLFPYSRKLEPNCPAPALRFLWHWRLLLEERVAFGKTQLERDLPWFGFSMLFRKRLQPEPALIFSDVATHNHFAIDQTAIPANSHAPALFLKPAFTDNISSIAGVLNSSCACFWMKQVFYPKGGDHVGTEGARVRKTLWDERYEFDGTKLEKFPVPTHLPSQLPTALVNTSTALQGQSPAATLASWGGPESGDLRPWLASARDLATRQRRQLIAWQEELDWQIYEAFGLVEGAAESGPAAVSLPEGAAVDAIPPEGIELGQRAFEIVLARRMAAGETQSTWFERHGSTPITEVPRHWPSPYRELVERRLRRIADDPAIRLIEQPEYKRRWNTEPWDKQQENALRQCLLNRLETYFHDSDRLIDIPEEAAQARRLENLRALRVRFAGGREPALVSVRQLTQVAQEDTGWMEVATVLAGRADFEVARLVETLVLTESVPFLPIQRYKPAGLRKRVEWEKTWDLQRQEDAVEVRTRKDASGMAEEALKKRICAAQLAEVGDIPVPPKYGSGDFTKATYWKLRGKLDVPKERWVLYPGAEGGHDESPVIAWAGWDHAQQAQALAGFYQQAKDTWGWGPSRLALLLAGLQELLPWLHQWHSDIDPTYNERLSTIYQQFYDTERHALRLTEEEVEKIRMGNFE